MYSCSADASASVEESDAVEELFLQVAEEVLHDGVVVAVGFAGHRMDRARVLQELAPGGVLVLESLSECTSSCCPFSRVASAPRSDELVSSVRVVALLPPDLADQPQ